MPGKDPAQGARDTGRVGGNSGGKGNTGSGGKGSLSSNSKNNPAYTGGGKMGANSSASQQTGTSGANPAGGRDTRDRPDKEALERAVYSEKQKEETKEAMAAHAKRQIDEANVENSIIEDIGNFFARMFGFDEEESSFSFDNLNEKANWALDPVSVALGIGSLAHPAVWALDKLYTGAKIIGGMEPIAGTINFGTDVFGDDEGKDNTKEESSWVGESIAKAATGLGGTTNTNTNTGGGTKTPEATKSGLNATTMSGTKSTSTQQSAAPTPAAPKPPATQGGDLLSQLMENPMSNFNFNPMPTPYHIDMKPHDELLEEIYARRNA